MSDFVRPSFYSVGGSRWRDLISILHLPYTMWHLGYVALGAGLASSVDWFQLAITLVVFFLAVGVAAHALDEMNGHPLQTKLTDNQLRLLTVGSLLVATAVGLSQLRIGWRTLPVGLLGLFFVAAYNLELFGGRFHSDWMFALQWGAYPVLCGGLLQSYSVRPAYVLGAAFGYFTSYAQRSLSLRARELRRGKVVVTGEVAFANRSEPVSTRWLIAPIESALRCLSIGVPLLAVCVLATHV